MILSHQLLSQLCKLSLPRPVSCRHKEESSKDYLIITVDIQSYFSDYNSFLLLTTLWKKKKNRLPDRLFS